MILLCQWRRHPKEGLKKSIFSQGGIAPEFVSSTHQHSGASSQDFFLALAEGRSMFFSLVVLLES